MRSILTLIRRQVVDNEICFALAGALSLALTVAVVSVGITESLEYLSGYAVTLILGAPVLICIGSFVLGVVQTHSDRMNGITAMLSTLPVGRTRILLVRFITGATVIMIALVPLAVTGTILWKLLGPPEWLFHNWLADVFIGLSLTALASYCLGLRAGQRAETFTSALRSLPLVLIVLLLVVARGFGRPLLAVLVPLTAVLLLRCSMTRTRNFLSKLVTGLTVLILLAVPLYVARNLCDGSLVGHVDAGARVSPSGLLPSAIENDPNIEGHSSASAYVLTHDTYHRLIGRFFRSVDWRTRELFDRFYLIDRMGIMEYFESLEKGRRHMHLQRPEWIYKLTHLDQTEGYLVYRRKHLRSSTEEHTWQWNDAKELRFGPGGVSNVPPNKSGRFGSPIVYFYSKSTSRFDDSPPQCVVYDADSRCFFAIDFENRTVRKGREIQRSSFRPINIGSSADSVSLDIDFDLPSTKLYKDKLPICLASTGYLPIVDESGQINLLDPNTLALHGPAGCLPRPKTLFGRAPSEPIDLLDYRVHLVATAPYDEHTTHLRASEIKGECLGLVAGSLSRQGLWTSVAVFDKDGRKIGSADSEQGLFDVPGGPALTITKCIFESLHPPVLTLASYFTAYSFEARSTHRALFLMPNSFVAMARDYDGNTLWKFLLVLLLMLPALLFSGVLGLRVARDATIIGLSRNARRFWIAGILAFGLAGYITYRLTRPKITLVTCANCGRPRRPDMNKCHRCGSKWHVPGLAPPTWRVLDK